MLGCAATSPSAGQAESPAAVRSSALLSNKVSADSAPEPIAEPVAAYIPLLSSSQVAWLRLPHAVTLGSEIQEVRKLAPDLLTPNGLIIEQEALTLRARSDERGQILTGISVQFAEASMLEAAISQWPAVQVVREGAQCSRIWLGPDGLRAQVTDPREVSAFGDCPEPSRSATTLLLEEYWSLDDLLPPQSARWGFEQTQSLLGASLRQLSEQFGARLSLPDDQSRALLSLPPLQISPTATTITLGMRDGQVRLLRADVSRGKTEGLDRETLVNHIAKKWGVLEELEPHVRLATTGNPRIEVELLGKAVRSITQRDRAECPLETNAQHEAAIQRMGDRWIERRETENASAETDPSKTPIFVNRGYRLGRRPGTLVHERTLAGGCLDHYWTLKRERSVCGNEKILSEEWGTDCCGPLQCAATPKMWMLRMFNAIQGKDVRLLKKLLDPTKSLLIHSIYGSAEVVVTRTNASLSSIASFPDWAPQSDGTQCSVQGDGRTLCVAGPPAYRMHFYWTGSGEQHYLNEIRVDTR